MPNSRSLRMMIAAAVLSGATAVAARRILRHWPELPPGVRLAIALLPVPFFVFFIFTEFRLIREHDEFHRRVFLESLAIAFPLAIAEGVTVEAVQSVGYMRDVTVGDLWPIMALTWLPALWIARRRYR
jgi:hypothetical protein